MKAELSWVGWVVAYVAIEGNRRLGFMGARGGSGTDLLILQDAIEYTCIEMVQQNTGMILRRGEGRPIEFTRAGCTVEIPQPLYIVRLDDLKGEDLNLFRQAREEAAALRQSLQGNVSSDAPRIHLPGRVQ